MRPFKPVGSLALLTILGCSSPIEPTDPVGSWGGQHVALIVTSGGGALDYDCAAGTIDEPLRPDSRGRFRVDGTHTPGQGGPSRQDDEPVVLPATYAGTIDSDTMTLTVTIVETGQSVGSFSLERDAAARIVRCL